MSPGISRVAQVDLTAVRRTAELVFCLIRPDLRWLAALGRYSDVEAVAFAKKITRAYSDGGWHILEQFVMVRVLLLDHADEAFGSDHVNALAIRVEIHIVALACGARATD